jgi:hypothetical protein
LVPVPPIPRYFESAASSIISGSVEADRSFFNLDLPDQLQIKICVNAADKAEQYPSD